MPNEGPYGGKIEIGEDGSIVWRAAARSILYGRDAKGTLEYAIRVLTDDRDTFASSDGQCTVEIHPASNSTFNVDSGAKSAFLIVSGYEPPSARQGSMVIGKSYFITGSSHDNNGNHIHEMPQYDVQLKYDEEDLYCASLLSEQQIAESDLSLCYQHWVSVHQIWKYYRQMHSVITKLNSRDLEKLRSLPEWGHHLSEDEAKMAIVWSRVYCHLARVRIPEETLERIDARLEEWSKADIWLSVWKEVTSESPPTTAEPPEAVDRRLVRPVSPLAVAKLTLSYVARLVVNVIGSPEISDEHFHAEMLDEDGIKRPISGIYVTGTRESGTPGTHTVSVTGVTVPGTFALMYHGAPTHYVQQGRGD